MLQKQSSVGYLKSTKINSQAKDKSFQFKRRIRRQYNPDNINIAKLFLVIREHRTGNPQLDKTNAIKELLTQVDNINDTDYNDNGNTPLHVAVSKRHLDIVKLLLSTRDINPKAKNNRGQTPLDIINEDLNSKSKTSLDQDIIQELQGASSLKRENTGENKPEVGSPKKLRISSIKKEEPEGTKIEEGDPRTYSASGLKHTLHGNIYQLKLLMLFLKRGLDQGYSFCLATEWDDAEKFDDLVFIYGDSREKNYRFLQAKHKLDEKNNKITVGDLFTKSKDGEFNLEKYFVSYLRIKKKKEFKDSNLKDFIVCTNISFDLDNSVQDQIKKLKEVSFGKNKGKKVLVEEIGEHDSFFNTDIGTRYRIKCNDDLVLHLKQGSEVQNEMRGQSVDIIGKEIKEFLEKLVFAVDQPNEVKLSEILEDEISEDFSKRFDYIGNLSKDAYNKFEKRMLGWLKEKEGRFFDNKEAEDLFREMEQAVNSLSIIERGVRNIEQKVSEVHSYIVVEQNNKKVKEKVLFNVENPSQLFTGKKEEPDKVHLLLQSTEKGVEVMSKPYSMSGYLEIVKLLKENGANLNTVDDNQSTPLHLAAKGGFLSIVEYLIENGANLNAVNYNEDTPLHLAAKGGFLDVVKLLKGKGANLNAENYNEYNAPHKLDQKKMVDP
ncbi:ankyrin repeat domain-containing protein, partial [Wolbachia endosymbiont of Protocalliphora sialia]